MRRSDFIELVLLGAIWGAAFPLTRMCASHFHIVTLITLRSFIAAIFLFLIMAFRGGWTSLIQSWKPIAALGVINTAVPFCLLAYTTTSVSAGFASIINSTAPIFGAIVAYIWLKEQLTLDRMVGLALGVAGVLVLSWNHVSFQPGGAGWGTITGLTATLCYGISANFTRQKLQSVDALAISAGSQVSAMLFLLPWAIYSGTSPDLAPADFAVAATLSIFCTALAYLLYFRLIHKIGPARAITCTFLIPVFGVLWGAALLGEIPTFQTIIGGCVVLIGTVLSTGVLRLLWQQSPSLR